MTINDQIRDEKLQYDIDRETAKISVFSSGKIHKYEYLTGEDILPSNKKQIIEQAKFTILLWEKLLKKKHKKTKTTEDQGQKQVDALENLKPKEEAKPTEDRSNNQSKATLISNDLISKRKKIMSELYDSIDYDNLNFEYVGPTKDVRFYEYMNSKELFNAIKNNQIKFSEVRNKQDNFLKKINEVKIGKKTDEQKKMIDNPNTFYNSREEVINF